MHADLKNPVHKFTLFPAKEKHWTLAHSGVFQMFASFSSRFSLCQTFSITIRSDARAGHVNVLFLFLSFVLRHGNCLRCNAPSTSIARRVFQKL